MVNEVTGKPRQGQKFSPATRAHAETVLRAFYDFQMSIGAGPVVNPFPLDRSPRVYRSNAFLGHFERRKLALGECGRAYGTSCQHEHSCIRCPVLRVDPAQRFRLVEIRDNLAARIAEADSEGWIGEAEGLRVSLVATEEKLDHIDRRARRAVQLNMPSFPAVAVRTYPRKVAVRTYPRKLG